MAVLLLFSLHSILNLFILLEHLAVANIHTAAKDFVKAQLKS